MNIITLQKISATLCLTVAAVAMGPPSAVLAADTDAPTKVVRFADLDIQKPMGARILYRRIQGAARQVCEVPLGSHKLLIAVEQKCIQQAIDDAVDSIHSAALSELRFGQETHLASR